MITLKTMPTQPWPNDGFDCPYGQPIVASGWLKMSHVGVRHKDAQVTDLINRVRYMMNENHEATIDTPITSPEDDDDVLVDDGAALEVLPVDSEDTRNEPSTEAASPAGWDYIEVELY